MKNGPISNQLKMQERQVYETKVQPANQQSGINVPDLGISFVFGLLTFDVNKGEEQIPMKRKKKKPKQGFRR